MSILSIDQFNTVAHDITERATRILTQDGVTQYHLDWEDGLTWTAFDGTVILVSFITDCGYQYADRYSIVDGELRSESVVIFPDGKIVLDEEGPGLTAEMEGRYADADLRASYILI